MRIDYDLWNASDRPHAPNKWIASVDEAGRLILPPEAAAALGLQPNSEVLVRKQTDSLEIFRPVEALARLYVEPTSYCNLDCLTCMRNVWDEPHGFMDSSTFGHILAGLQAFSPLPSIFMSGYGEPLSHPHILDMIAGFKRLGARVELLTNATLLTGELASRLIDLELDTLWISIDGATSESYSDVRLGAALPRVIENITRLRSLRRSRRSRFPQTGFAFVAMQQNVQDLPAVLKLGLQLGVSRFSISNVLAHTPDLNEQRLYKKALDTGEYQVSSRLPSLNFPRMDLTPETAPALLRALSGDFQLRLGGEQVGQHINRCPFLERGSAAVRWDGALSPCPPLLHTHESYLDNRLRRSHAHSFGNVNEHSLANLWQQDAYAAFRKRVRDFDFSPCTFCNSCEMASKNLEDCYANLAPTCGGCLWAQGLIQCP